MTEDDSMKRMLGWLATATALTLSAPVIASQNDPRLGAMFDRLKTTPDAGEAAEIEQDIWRIWHQSDDETVEKMMTIGLRAMAFRDHLGALEAFDRIVKTAPEFAEGWNKRATIHYLMGNYRAAIADIEKTLMLEPRHFGALSGLGLVHLALDDEAAALRAFDAALAIHPTLPGAETHIKELREKLGGRPI